MVAAHRIKEADWKASVAGSWMGANADHKGLTEVIGDAKRKDKPKPKSIDASSEWMRLSAGLNGAISK